MDHPAIERHLTQAVDAARQAVAVRPSDQDARYLLSACQRRLDDLLAGRKVASKVP